MSLSHQVCVIDLSCTGKSSDLLSHEMYESGNYSCELKNKLNPLYTFKEGKEDMDPRNCNFLTITTLFSVPTITFKVSWRVTILKS